MKIAVLTERGFDIREREMPRCGPDDLLVKTVSCGICEGDVTQFRNVTGQKQQGGAPVELVLGHEGSGVVEEVGRNVRGFAKGDRVTALDGCYAEYFAVGPWSVVKLPAEIDPAWAMGEPIACCVHAGNRFGIRLGDSVAVIGSGFMGLLCLQIARLKGAGLTCVFDVLPERLAGAKKFGADVTVDASAVSAREIVASRGPFDVVIEAAGTQSALDMCGELVKEHGRVLIVGYHIGGGGTRTVNMPLWNWKAIDVINAHVRRNAEKLDAMRAGMELVRAGRLEIRSLVTPYPLARVNDAFRDLVARKQGLVKAATSFA